MEDTGGIGRNPWRDLVDHGMTTVPDEIRRLIREIDALDPDALDDVDFDALAFEKDGPHYREARLRLERKLAALRGET